MVLFLDTNVLIDYLICRPCTDSSKKIIQSSIENNYAIYISVISVVNCFYILRKEFTVAELRKKFFDIFKFIDVVEVNKKNILEAIEANSFIDYEDCVQVKAAENINADFIITRNEKDFESSSIPAISPEQFLEQN